MADTSDLSLPKIEVVGIGSSITSGSTKTLPAITAGGVGLSANVDSDNTLLLIFAEGEGASDSGSSSKTLPARTAVSSGLSGYLGISTATRPAITALGVAITANTGQSDVTLHSILPSGAALRNSLGISSVTLAAIVASGVARTNSIGTSSVTLSMIEAVGSTVIQDFWDGWAYNLNTGAPSFYEQFKFNSFARVGNDYYGLNATGLYLLGADDDAGEPINCTVTLGRSDFGEEYTKKIPIIYAGAKSDRPMLLTARVDDELDYTYEFTSAPRALSRCRVILGRGLEGSYWELELANQYGADMELSSLDIPTIPNSRRI